MITQGILTVFFGLVNGLLSVIPATPALPNGITDALNSIFGLIMTIGDFLPLDTLASVLIIILAVYNIKIIMDIVSWVLRKIPTMSG